MKLLPFKDINWSHPDFYVDSMDLHSNSPYIRVRGKFYRLPKSLVNVIKDAIRTEKSIQQNKIQEILGLR